ncbi:MAG: hypothetical protein ACYDA9_16310 [Terriglobia bacterium]
MKPTLLVAIFSLVVVSSEPAVFAKRWALAVPKGATVVVKAPVKFWKPEDPSVSTGVPIFSVDTSAVLAKQDWQTAGLPYFGEFLVTKIFQFKPFYKLRYTDVELRNGSTWVKLRFEPGSDINAGFRTLTFTGTWKELEGGDYFKNVVFGTVGSAIFTGPLSRVSDSVKLALLRIAGTGLATLSSESRNDKVYIGFSFPPSGTVYNSLKLNEAARAATVINSRLAMLKGLAVFGADAGVDGIKISETVFYRDFVSEKIARSDSLQVYVPLTAIKRFSSDDITSQQFVDQCIVIVNSNRIQVLLSNAA